MSATALGEPYYTRAQVSAIELGKVALTCRPSITLPAGSGPLRELIPPELGLAGHGTTGGSRRYLHRIASETYRQWLRDAALRLELERFVSEGNRGHTFVVASR